MKKLFFLFLFSIIFSSAFGQNKYFHELKGVEDSSGVTHLFYRMYEDVNGESSSDNSCVLWRDDIHHLDTATGSDSLKYKSLRQERCLPSTFYYQLTTGFSFLDNDIDKWTIIDNSLGSYDNKYGYLKRFNGSFFHAGYNWINKHEIVYTDTVNFAVMNFRKSSIINIMNGDSLASENYAYPVLVKPINGEGPEEICTYIDECFYGKSDSVLIYDYNFLAADKHQKGSIYFQRNDSLFWSDNLGKTMNFLNDDFDWSSFNTFIFGQDSSTIFSVTEFTDLTPELRPDTARYFQLLKSSDNGHSWQEISSDSGKIYMSQPLDENNTFYTANKQAVYETTDYGESFSKLLTFDYPVTGLHKKPDSDILYVLTKEELFELNVATKETTSLKKLPVSMENEPTFTPQKITLEQNYPNPFNPSTVIRYQLAGNSLVRLEVFDITGRKAAVLVDGERQSAGTHQVTFDAGALSSGMYFYRLQAGGKTVTLRMTLMK